MRKGILILGFIILGGLFLKVSAEHEYSTRKDSLLYLREYRYGEADTKSSKEFREYIILLKTVLKVYFEFTSLGSQNFSRDTLHYAEWLLTKTHFLNVFLMVCDRMLRNMAFDPRLYDINIKTGKANDHFASRVIK